VPDVINVIRIYAHHLKVYKFIPFEFPNKKQLSLNVLEPTQFLQKSYIFVIKRKRECELTLKKC
tara:strand:- start:224 stop:415 length:192 start_codon:yes stop_codon:yes gene_type:complete